MKKQKFYDFMMDAGCHFYYVANRDGVMQFGAVSGQSWRYH